MEMGVVFSIPLLLNKLGRRWTLIMMLCAATTFSCLFVFWPKGKFFADKLLCHMAFLDISVRKGHIDCESRRLLIKNCS